MKFQILSSVFARTTNDTNGNPRRGWLVSVQFADKRTAYFFDEGYNGYSAIPSAIRTEVMSNCIWCDVTIKQYKEFLRTYGMSVSERAVTDGLTVGNGKG